MTVHLASHPAPPPAPASYPAATLDTALTQRQRHDLLCQNWFVTAYNEDDSKLFAGNIRAIGLRESLELVEFHLLRQGWNRVRFTSCSLQPPSPFTDAFLG